MINHRSVNHYSPPKELVISQRRGKWEKRSKKMIKKIVPEKDCNVVTKIVPEKMR